MARRKPRGRAKSWLARIAALAVLVAMLAGGWFWWEAQHWTPSEDAYPDQGLIVGTADGAVNFRTARALGARFVYLEASSGDSGHDAVLAGNMAAASAAGLQIGAVHVFDPCLRADPQSANFVTMVPRDDSLLPPAIELTKLATDCAGRVSDAAVESELMTFINQVESHSGKAAILKIAAPFEETYRLGARMERGLWLTRTRFEPDYVGRPWLMWTANEHFSSAIADAPLRWVVVRP